MQDLYACAQKKGLTAVDLFRISQLVQKAVIGNELKGASQ